jgi:Na+/H+ antiporter NhaD/arsenite permease-like protein
LLQSGVALLIAADMGFAYLTLSDRYTSTNLVNLGWPFGFLFVAYAAALSAGWQLTYAIDEDKPRPRARHDALPLVIIPPLLAFVVFASRGGPLSLSLPLSFMAIVAALAVLVRQAITHGVSVELARSRRRLVAWADERHRKAA